jgi:phycoerythrin-associated linker protein
MEHVTLMNTEGYEAEISSYTYSEEYLAAFGIDQVPHNRSSDSMSGGRTINYTRGIAVDAGFAGYDAASNGSKLLNSLSTGNAPAIVDRKSVGNAKGISIVWTTRRQVSANRRVMQKSVVSQRSMSATLRSIQAQGGRIMAI